MPQMSRWAILLIYYGIIAVMLVLLGLALGFWKVPKAHADEGVRDGSVLFIAGGTVALENPQLVYLQPNQGFWLVGQTGTVLTAYNPATGQYGFLIYGPTVPQIGFVPSSQGGGLIYATAVLTPAQFQATLPEPAPIHINLWNPGDVFPGGASSTSIEPPPGPVTTPPEPHEWVDHPGLPGSR